MTCHATLVDKGKKATRTEHLKSAQSSDALVSIISFSPFNSSFCFVFLPSTYQYLAVYTGFPGGLDGKESACRAGDLGSIPVLGRPPGEGSSNPLQYSCLENPMDRGVYIATK